MKKYNTLFNIGIVILSAAIIAVVIFKFFLNRKPSAPFAINQMKEIRIFDLRANELKLSDLIPLNRTVHVLIFKLKDCHSCIADGVEMLTKLQKEGRQCLAMAVHDHIEDIEGWTINFDFRPFYMIRTIDYIDHIKCPLTPVLLKLEHQKVESYMYLLPH